MKNTLQHFKQVIWNKLDLIITVILILAAIYVVYNIIARKIENNKLSKFDIEQINKDLLAKQKSVYDLEQEKDKQQELIDTYIMQIDSLIKLKRRTKYRYKKVIVDNNNNIQKVEYLTDKELEDFLRNYQFHLYEK